MTKYAVLSMDIEDWYHLDYFSGMNTNRSVSMLDGVERYIDLLGGYGIQTTFFALSELIDSAGSAILCAAEHGHEIACHGKSHIRPNTMAPSAFAQEISEAKDKLAQLTGREIVGYRAPCYSIDRERYDLVRAAGFRYDSSKIAFAEHPLYGKLELCDFEQPLKGVWQKEDFFEFELPTTSILKRNIPVSGGGYIRIFPWLIMRPMIARYLESAQIYVLYIHPFELSETPMPRVEGSAILTNVRARTGLGRVYGKMHLLIQLLTQYGFQFRTFSQLRDAIIRSETVRAQSTAQGEL